MKKFSYWLKWIERDKLIEKKYPGIYCIAISKSDISKQKFSWVSQIKYIGMTNSIKGLKGRLDQFDKSIQGKFNLHGGADRFKYKHSDYNTLVKQLFVSACSFKCDVKSNFPKDLKVMGDVVKFEYDCFAKYVEKFNALPEFNDKKKSPKYSRTHKRQKELSNYFNLNICR